MSRVTVKFGKKKHKKVEIKGTDSFEDVQGIIFSLTQLSPERQKIIVSGKKLENDADVARLIKKGVLITVMGSNAVNAALSSSQASKIKFVDDMTVAEKQKALAELPPGLYNLGNTCYLNACLQCVKAIPELNTQLKTYCKQNSGSNNMPAKLGQLLGSMDSSAEPVMPQQFVQFFRAALPRFATRNEQGVWQQQDADEAYTEIISALRQDTSFVESDEAKTPIINTLFEGEFESEMSCAESEQEKDISSTDAFIKLQCFIDSETRHINDGIKTGFAESVEKRSDVLQRNAIWKKSKAISKLPRYMPIQLVRFFWKQKTQKNAKILRKVIFPHKLDVYAFCNKELKNKIEKYRKLKLELEDRQREKKHAVQPEQQEEQKPKIEMKSSDMDCDTNNEAHCTGYYELCAVVTHKGRSANSGHYIGYAKDLARDKWLKFDDEDVTQIEPDDVKQLYGGGDHQMAFMCFYRQMEPDLKE